MRVCCTSWKNTLDKLPGLWEKLSREKWKEFHTDKNQQNIDWHTIYFNCNQQTNIVQHKYTGTREGLWGTSHVNITQGPYAWLMEVDRVYGGTSSTITIKAINTKTKNTIQHIELLLPSYDHITKLHRFTVAFKHHTSFNTPTFTFNVKLHVRVTNRGEILEDQYIWEQRYQFIKDWFVKQLKRKNNVPKTKEKLINAIKGHLRNNFKPKWMDEEQTEFYNMIPMIFADRLESEGEFIKIKGN